MKIASTIIVLAFVISCVGCSTGILAKRQSELNCPTDVRQMHTWAMGEDAILWGPCGLSSGNYGHKATSWRDWPMDVNSWRNTSGVVAGCETGEMVEGELVPPGTEGPSAVPGQGY